MLQKLLDLTKKFCMQGVAELVFNSSFLSHSVYHSLFKTLIHLELF